jgi:hypothetical protein
MANIQVIELDQMGTHLMNQQFNFLVGKGGDIPRTRHSLGKRTLSWLSEIGEVIARFISVGQGAAPDPAEPELRRWWRKIRSSSITIQKDIHNQGVGVR